MAIEYIEIKPTKIRENKKFLEDIVRASFSKIKSTKNNKDSYSLTVYIGKKIANELALKAGEKMSIFHAKENQRIWFIKKAIKSGYKLVDVSTANGSPSASLRFQLKWRLFIPEEKELGIREVEFSKIADGITTGLTINANR